jgi:DNA primase
MDAKEQIKRSVSITEVVSLYVDLKPAGKYLKALCPFHTEKTPSFFVMPDKDSFSCYGCNKFGDIFTFIQEIENLNFPEAMNFLIDKFNIPVERDNTAKGFKKDVYAKINQMAMKYFRDNLLDSPEGKKALEYLAKRGISRDTTELFSLGYAQNQWDGLYGYLRKHSGDIGKAIELGLLIKSDNHRIYDRFRGRIIFPIFPESDPHTPIAFGGRTIFDDPGKYLNSPDTPLYKKSKHLYGFHLAKKSIRDTKYAVLVEGYFPSIKTVLKM